MGTRLKCCNCMSEIEGDRKGTFTSCECGNIYIDETPYYTRIGGNSDDILIFKDGDWKRMSELDSQSKKETNDFCIFLDIDGVLNNQTYWDKCYEKHKKNTMNMEHYPFDPKCLNNLMKLSQEIEMLGYELKIILSSTWRLEKISTEIVKARIAEYGLELSGKTKQLGNRGEEISTYLEENYDKEFSKYLILDDYTEEIKEIHDIKNIVQTNINRGFDNKVLDKALEKLYSLEVSNTK